MHKHKFAELAAFQENTNVFHANTNSSLKNFETQVGQLAFNLQKQSRDSFPSDTKKNTKDCMAIILRNGKEVQVRKEVEKNQNDDETEKENQNQVSKEKKKNRIELTNESEQLKVHIELSTIDTMQKNKEEVRIYQPPIPFPQRLKQSKLDDQFSKFLNMFKKLEINISFAEALAQIPYYGKFMKDIIRQRGN